MDEIVRGKREEILRAAAKRGAYNVRVFGSVARGEAGRSLLDLAGLMGDLEDLLGRKIDLVDDGGLHWYIRDRVLQEAVPL